MAKQLFLSKLEALRGVAAMMVALGHSWLVLSPDGITNLWARTYVDLEGTQAIMSRLMLIFFNGGVAVTIFFVISGFVLGLSLDRDNLPFLPKCLSFYFKRVFRIIPVHVSALAIICCFLLFFHRHEEYPNTSTWFNWWYTTQISLKNVLNNAILHEINLNPITWTLQVEIILSFLFPVLHLLNRHSSTWLNPLVLFILIFISYKYSHALSQRYAFVFYLGLMIPQWGKRFWHRKSPFFCYLALCSSVSLLLFTRFFIPEKLIFFITIAEGVLSACMISLIGYREELRIFKVLETRTLRILGRISYSFYVYHFFILYIIATILLKTVPANITVTYSYLLGFFFAFTSVIVTLCVTLPLSKYFEMPLTKMAKSLVAKHTQYLT